MWPIDKIINQQCSAGQCPDSDQPPPPDPCEGVSASITTEVADLTVDVTGSSNGATPVTYDWGWGDGSPHGTGATASHSYAAGGTYTITLTVTDANECTATAQASVTVAEAVDVVAEFIFITQICDGGVGGEAMVEIPGYSPGEIPAGQSVLWDLGGATLVTGSLTDGSVIFSGGAGPYTITLTVYAGPNQTGASTSVSHDTISCE